MTTLICIYTISCIWAFLVAGLTILNDGDKDIFDRSYYKGQDSKFEMALMLTIFPVANTIIVLIDIFVHFNYYTAWVGWGFRYVVGHTIWQVKHTIWKIKMLLWYYKNNQY